jgi:flagellar biosynthesis GTPase FlhF
MRSRVTDDGTVETVAVVDLLRSGTLDRPTGRRASRRAPVTAAHSRVAATLADAAPRHIRSARERRNMADDHERDRTMAKEKDEEEEAEDIDEAEAEAREAAREQRNEDAETEVERDSEVREEEAAEQENIDNHRDGEPFES